MFAAQWLDLREPADHRARNADLQAAVARHLIDQTQVTVTDLACGTGAMMRALAPHLPARQSWRLVDHDADLLAAIDQRCRGLSSVAQAIAWQPHHADVQNELEAIIALPADLVTISAFLDLTSAAWLERLADAAAAHRRAIYASLIYDGRVACEPVDPFDAQVLLAFNAHQRRDKGFGAAAGPQAAAQLSELLVARGFNTRLAQADWVLDDHDARLQEEFVQGWYQAACEQDMLDRRELDLWLMQRLESVRARSARITVGHCDIWAYPPAPQPRSRSNSTS